MPSIGRYFSNKIILLGFGAVFALSISVVIVLLMQIDIWSRSGFELVRNNIQQTQLILTMRDAIQKRIMTVQYMISLPGDFDRDAASLRYYNLAAVYAQARQELEDSGPGEELQHSLERLDEAVNYAQPFQNNLVEAMIFEEISREELQRIFVEGSKAADKVLLMLDRIVQLQSSAHHQVIDNYEVSMRYTVLGVSGVFVLIVVVVVLAVRATSKQFRQVSRLTIMDELTEIHNRRYFDMVLEEEWKRSMREYTSISLLMLDIDFFKSFNDKFGHQRGDECLREVARVISAQVKRASDFCARYGGEEFVVVLPNTTAEHARLLAERIRRAVEDARIRAVDDSVSLWVTISIGVATTTAEYEQTSSTLVKAADNCLYQSKHNGRNRVTECVLEDLK